MRIPLLHQTIAFDHDVVTARQLAREIARALGVDGQDQIRIATVVSELARNAFRYAQGGTIDFSVETGPPAVFFIQVEDKGPGIPNLQEILDGTYVSATGLGHGLNATRRAMDHFKIETSREQGTRVEIGRELSPMKTLSPASLAGIAKELTQRRRQGPLEEIQQQNQELLAALSELERNRSELTQLNQELEETNRGVVALYAELDEKAESLRRASEIKSSFLSNMTHEFRTPLNSILSLSRLLLDRLDGPLTPDQEKQIQFIRRSALGLSELVNDLLDLAKIEAGKVTLRITEFKLEEVFGGLRGMMRPLMAGHDAVNLVIEPAGVLPELHTDENKLSQILRNLISNALKFTETGEVRVTGRIIADGRLEIEVTDTGIGIAPEDQARIFEEFSQVDHSIQKKVRGTGLGLPLSRKLAELLGGSLTVSSEPGRGSTFRCVLPLVHPDQAEENNAGSTISSHV
jgi:signal transduction histidine kinase